jgi:CRP/FNR family cyclic AMP-dependent transcriptional regulator
MTEDALPEILLAAFAAHGRIRTYRHGTVIVTEGDLGTAIFVITAGRVIVYASSDEGRDIVLAEYGPGEYFGELTLDGGRRVASVRAIESVTCRLIDKLDLQAVIGQHPEFALHLMRKLSRMVRRATEQVKSLALQDVYSRLTRLLMELSDEQSSGIRIVRERLTQQDLADRIGSSREMVNRILKDLTTGGYVRVADGHYEIQRKLPLAR